MLAYFFSISALASWSLDSVREMRNTFRPLRASSKAYALPMPSVDTAPSHLHENPKAADGGLLSVDDIVSVYLVREMSRYRLCTISSCRVTTSTQHECLSPSHLLAGHRKSDPPRASYTQTRLRKTPEGVFGGT
jgi:hypothetical protein